jgi:ABC-type transporter Mla subunit MlaD
MGLFDSLTKGNPLADMMGDITKVIAFVQQHGDDIVRLVQNTPKLLGEAGDGLVTAAEAATNASGFLSGGDSPIHSLIGVASDALDSCRDELTAAVSMVQRLAGMVHAVHSGAASELTDHAEKLLGVAAGLGSVSSQFRVVGDRLNSTGEDLGRMGGQLHSTGTRLASFGPQIATAN